MLKSVVKISMMSAKYFEYYTNTYFLGGGAFFVDTLYIQCFCDGTRRYGTTYQHLFHDVVLVSQISRKITTILHR